MLQSALLYGPELSEDSARSLDRLGGGLTKWIKLREELVRSDKQTLKSPTDSQPDDGLFQDMHNRARITTVPDLAGPSGEPLVLRCTDDESMRCAAGGTLSNGVQVFFQFRAYPGLAASAARMYYRQLDDLVEALAVAPDSKED